MHAGAGGVPIIVLSGLAEEVLAITTVQQGAQDDIPKEQTDSASLARGILHAIERCRIQHALAEERDLLRGLLDNIPDQVYMKDTESRFISVNSATARFFGVSSPDQVVGNSDFDFFPAGLAAMFRAEEQALLCGNPLCPESSDPETRRRERIATDQRHLQVSATQDPTDLLTAVKEILTSGRG
jgi:PAS domain-containing protein